VGAASPWGFPDYNKSFMPRFSIFRSALCGVAIYVLLLAGLNSVGLVGPDEPRYADVARAMYTSGDYVTPRLFGSPWFEKPPLYYWLAAASFHLGISEFSARFPSALFALLFLGIWHWFSDREYGEGVAGWSCLIMATSLGWIGFARAASMDMLLTTTLSAALAFFLSWWREQKSRDRTKPVSHRREWMLYAFYVALALATLAKGPLAVALAGLVVAGCMLHSRDWSLIPGMLLTPAVGVYAIIALPWYILCYVRNGWPFVEEFFIRHNLERFTSGEIIGHPQPFWFYLAVLPIAIFPWAPVLFVTIGAFLAGGWRDVAANRRLFPLLYWVALPFIFFSISANKLPGYLLPILPPLSLLLAQAIAGSSGEREPGSRFRISGTWSRVALCLTAVLLLAVPLFSWVLPESLATGLKHAIEPLGSIGLLRSISSGGVPVVIWTIASLLILGAILLSCRGQLWAAGSAIGLSVCVCLSGLLIYMTPVINGVASVRNVAERAVSLGVDPQSMGTLYIHRTQAYGLGFYLATGLPEWNPDDPTQHFDFVAARDDFQVDELRPGAHLLASFPRQNLRLWALPHKQPSPLSVPASLHSDSN
jgi:4-amino-4-deoxy-L-arabinose transferase-like glycosyltransferase